MSGTKVDLETLRAAINEYKAIRDELEAAHRVGRALVEVKNAGNDQPSKVYATWARHTGTMHQTSNDQLRKTLTTRIDNLEATLRQYEQTEHGNTTNLKPKD